MIFKNRSEAGKKLAEKLKEYKGNKNAIVIGLPRGGVVIAFEVARELNLELDIIVTRKVGAPMQPELAVGALTQDGEPILDRDFIEKLGIHDKDLEPIIQAEQDELQRRLELYRGGKESLDLNGKVAIIVDDGVATGATMRAAIKSARKLGAEKIVVAIPVSPKDALEKIKSEADVVICLDIPDVFFGVGGFYQEFAQTEDEQVISLLKNAANS